MLVRNNAIVPSLGNLVKQIPACFYRSTRLTEMQKVEPVTEKLIYKKRLPRQEVGRGDDYPFHSEQFFTS